MSAREPILVMRAIRKRFPGVLALDDVDFDVRPGEVHALMGQNGAGKSTLIKVLTGVHSPDAGEMTFLGRPLHVSSPADAQARGISTIYQEVNLVPTLSVAELFLGRLHDAGTASTGNRRRAPVLLGPLLTSTWTFARRWGVPRPSSNDRRPGRRHRRRLIVPDEPTSTWTATRRRCS